MADKTPDTLEEAKEKSLNASPTPISRATLVGAVVFAIIIIIGIIMIGNFFLSDRNEAGQNSNAAQENVGP